MPTRMLALPAPRLRPSSRATAFSSCRSISSPGGTNISSLRSGPHPWKSSLLDSFASSDDTVYLPGFVRVDAGVFANHGELEGAVQCREPLQQGLLGLGGWQQQSLAGPRADVSSKGHGKLVTKQLSANQKTGGANQKDHPALRGPATSGPVPRRARSTSSSTRGRRPSFEGARLRARLGGTVSDRFVSIVN